MRGRIKQADPPAHSAQECLEAIEAMLDEVQPLSYFEAQPLVRAVLRNHGWRMGTSFGSGSGPYTFHTDISHRGAPQTFVETTWTPRAEGTPAPTFEDKDDSDA